MNRIGGICESRTGFEGSMGLGKDWIGGIYGSSTGLSDQVSLGQDLRDLWV